MASSNRQSGAHLLHRPHHTADTLDTAWHIPADAPRPWNLSYTNWLRGATCTKRFCNAQHLHSRCIPPASSESGPSTKQPCAKRFCHAQHLRSRRIPPASSESGPMYERHERFRRTGVTSLPTRRCGASNGRNSCKRDEVHPCKAHGITWSCNPRHRRRNNHRTTLLGSRKRGSRKAHHWADCFRPCITQQTIHRPSSGAIGGRGPLVADRPFIRICCGFRPHPQIQSHVFLVAGYCAAPVASHIRFTRHCALLAALFTRSLYTQCQ